MATYENALSKSAFDKAIAEGVEQAMKECELTIGLTLKEAVEKQIPKKPLKSDRESRYCEVVFKCPTCGYESMSRVIDYCSHCGQRLKWGE